jgi:hypothetical protein
MIILLFVACKRLLTKVFDCSANGFEAFIIHDGATTHYPAQPSPAQPTITHLRYYQQLRVERGRFRLLFLGQGKG